MTCFVKISVFWSILLEYKWHLDHLGIQGIGAETILESKLAKRMNDQKLSLLHNNIYDKPSFLPKIRKFDIL